MQPVAVPGVPARIPTARGLARPTLLERSGDLARLDDFEPLRRLGGGGMAEVLLARTRVGPPRLVVIKRLRRRLVSQPVFTNMFLDEIQVTARLDHAHLVRLAEPGYSLVDWFLVLEPIPGLPLSKLLKRLAALTQGSAALSPRAAALIAGQIASGLHYAHTMRDESGNPMNIVHRDVSPENIMVAWSGRAKLIDFGISKLTGRAAFTRPGDVKGKIGYVAPEQIQRAGHITHRTDIFTLGVVLWEMLTGKRLFFRKTYAQSLKALLEERIVPPSEVREIPALLDGIVMRALCPDPDQRFVDAGEMADALLGMVAKHADAAEVEIAEKVQLVRVRSSPPEPNPTSKATAATASIRKRPAPPEGGERATRNRLKDRLSPRSSSDDNRGRLWLYLSGPWMVLAMLVLLNVGLRFLRAGSGAPTFRTVSTVGKRAPLIEPMRRPAHAVPTLPGGAASGLATARSVQNADGPRPRRSTIKEAHIPRSTHRSHGGLTTVRATKRSSRRSGRVSEP